MTPIHWLLEGVVAFLIVLGGSFALIGSWGLARLRTVMARLHGPTKATTLGVGSCLIGSMVYFPAAAGIWSAHELLITLFLFISAPISANMIAKAHLHQQRHGIDPESPAEAALPSIGGRTDWATFCQAAEDAGGDPPRASTADETSGLPDALSRPAD